MSNNYSTPEQQSRDPENARRRLVAEARYGLQKGLLGLYPQMASDLARQRVINMQLVERSIDTPAANPIYTEAPQLESKPITSEPTPLSPEQASQEATRQKLLEDAYNQINEAHAA